jgi:hypothetical protein
MRYDADRQPDQAWLELDEGEQIDLVMAYHRRKRVKLENAKVHATAHVVVENQIARSDPPLVPATFARLLDEGLSRHDAIHAIGCILLGIIFDVMRTPDDGRDPNMQYNRELATLSAASWRALASDPGAGG